MKKIIALLLLLSLIFPVSAYDKNFETGCSYNYGYYEVDLLKKQNINSSSSKSSPNFNFLDELKFEELNKDNIESAKVALKKLNLQSKGLGYLEDACIAELNLFEKNDDVILHEYKVLIPYSRKNPRFYKRYNGVDFYSDLTSKSNITLKKMHFAKYDKLSKWLNNSISLGMTFSNVWSVTLAHTIANLSLPKNYKVHTSDWMDSYINMNPVNRAIYAKKDGKFVNLVNREFGKVRPYFIYHCNDATSSVPTVTIYYNYKDYPDANNNDNTSLLKLAKVIYDNDANPLNFRLEHIIGIRWR